MFRDLSHEAPPSSLLRLRQFWQLARDCELVDDCCDLADINRLVVYSGREAPKDKAFLIKHMAGLMGIVDEEEEEVEAKAPAPLPALADEGDSPTVKAVAEAVAAIPLTSSAVHDTQPSAAEGGDYGPSGMALRNDLSTGDPINPHHPNNQVHAYEFFEAILRVSVAYGVQKMQTKKGRSSTKKGGKKNSSSHGGGGGGGGGGLRLSDCFHAMLSENLLRHSCSHAPSMSERDWVYCSPSIQALAAEYRIVLEKIFRYFSVDDPDQVVDGQLFWKARSRELLDNCLSFNEILTMCQDMDLFDANFTPKHAVALYKRCIYDRVESIDRLIDRLID